MKSHLTNKFCTHTLHLQKMLFSVLLLGITLTAHAVPIDGTIGFSGDFTPIATDGTPTTLDAATGIDFIDDEALVLTATGDFMGLAFQIADFTDFQFASFVGVSPLWSVGGFSFDLTSVVVGTQTASELKLSGLGSVSKTGFETTSGTWEFTGDSTGSVFAWSGGGTAAVPAPPALWILWSGLVGMIGVSRINSMLRVHDGNGLTGQET